MVDYSMAYARALTQIALEEHRETEFGRQLDALQELWAKNPEVVSFFDHPGIPADRKRSVLHDGFQKELDPFLFRFLEVLIRAGHAHLLKTIVRDFQHLLLQAQNVECVQVESAVSLSPAQAQDLQKMLETKLHKSVKMDIRIVPGLIAGLRIKTGDLVLDNTVASGLDRLKSSRSAR